MEDSLDSLLLKQGTVLTEEELIDSKKVIDAVETKLKPSLAYSDDITPGDEIEINTQTMSKEEANQNMIRQVAMNKLEKEKKEEKAFLNSMSDSEKIKFFVCQAEYDRNCNDYFNKNGYELSGQQKHALKRKIEHMWKKGKYRLSAKQKQDILYEINKASYSGVPYPASQPSGSMNMTNIGSMLMH